MPVDLSLSPGQIADIRKKYSEENATKILREYRKISARRDMSLPKGLRGTATVAQIIIREARGATPLVIEQKAKMDPRTAAGKNLIQMNLAIAVRRFQDAVLDRLVRETLGAH